MHPLSCNDSESTRPRVDHDRALGLGSGRARGEHWGRPRVSVLRIISGPASGTSHQIEGELVIGREDADLTVADGEISRRHAVIRPAGRGVVVEDLGSMNGTFVDGERINAPVTLTENATIRCGKSELALELSVAPPAEEPIADIAQDTRARDVPVAPVDDATRARDVPVAPVDDATRARDVPVAPVDDATRARDVPVAAVAQPTTARGTAPPSREPSSQGGPLTTTVGGIPVLVFGLLGLILLIVLLVLLLG
jgi:hypothetical protein